MEATCGSLETVRFLTFNQLQTRADLAYNKICIIKKKTRVDFRVDRKL